MHGTEEASNDGKVKVFGKVDTMETYHGTSDGLFLLIYPPRSMCIVLGFDDL